MSLKLAAIFKDFMVVQRNRPITVFGTGVPKTVVTVSLHTSFSKTVVAADGTWCATLPPLAAGTDYVLTVSDGTTEEQRKQVAVGEVWLAGGQSNMELALRDSADGVAVSKAYTGTQIRFYQVPKRAVLDETHQQLEAQSAWKIAAAENVGDLSAVAFYFAKRLAQKMDCVIGIVDCYWGGTSIACWMSESMMQSVAAGQKQLADYKAEVGTKTAEQYAAEMRYGSLSAPASPLTRFLFSAANARAASGLWSRRRSRRVFPSWKSTGTRLRPIPRTLRGSARSFPNANMRRSTIFSKERKKRVSLPSLLYLTTSPTRIISARSYVQPAVRARTESSYPAATPQHSTPPR